MSVPLYLNSPLPGGKLVIDNQTDLPIYQGLVPVQFTVCICMCMCTVSRIINFNYSIPLETHPLYARVGGQTRYLSST